MEDGLAALLDPALDPAFWPASRTGAASAWWGHVPFAHWLVATTRPARIVELGTHNGVSYTAFCEAVRREGLACRCTAVDTWIGDPQAGTYGEEVFADLRAFHDARYAAFSDLKRCTFQEALPDIADGSVDLLHIDGLHEYDAVRGDFEGWRPKLSTRGVVLLHDTEVDTPGFGVRRLWAEISQEYPAFAFTHCYGLGVLAVGMEAAPVIQALAALDGASADRLRSRFAALGARWEAAMEAGIMRAGAAPACATHDAAEAVRLGQVLATAEARLVSQAARLDAAARDAEVLVQERQRAEAAEASMERERDALLGAAARDTEALVQERQRAEAAQVSMEREREMFLRSTSWRVTAPLRWMGRLLGRHARPG